MALIIKNADVDKHQAKKVNYTTIVTDNNTTANEDADWINAAEAELDNDSSDVNVEALVDHAKDDNYAEFENPSDDELPQEIDVPEFELVEQGIKHQGVHYIHPDILEEMLNEKMTSRITELENLVEERKEEGYQEGYQEGTNKAKNDNESVLDNLAELVSSIENAFEAKTNDLESLITDAIFIGVTRILGEAIVNDNERINMIQNVVKTIGTLQPYTLRLSEYDYNILSAHNSEMKKFNIKNLISDDRVELGGCIIDTEKGIFDGRLEVQLARLKDVIDSKVD